MNEIMLSGIPAIDNLKVKKPTNIDPARAITLTYPFASAAERSKNVTFTNILEAYKEDGYFHRAVLRYVQLGSSDGFRIKASPKVAKYIEARLQIAASLDKNTTTGFLKQCLRDIILCGNVFLLPAYTAKMPSLCGFSLVPRVAAGLFAAPANTMLPVYDKTGNLVKWQYRDTGPQGYQISKDFDVNDVILLTYDKGTNSIFGTPAFVAVVADIMAERLIEDSILKLVYKYPNPIVHIETPPMGSSKDDSASEDMQRIANMVRSMSSDSALITAPGQKVSLLGAESRALRMEEYLGAFKKRIFAGLGMNAQMIGEEVSNQKDIELDRITRDQAEDFIDQFREQFLQKVLNLFLKEANISEDVEFELTDPDPLYRIKLETHVANMFTMNLTTEDETRERMGLDPMTPQQYKNTRLYRVTLPELMEPLQLQLAAASIASKATPKPSRPSGAVKPPQNQHS